MFRIHMLPAGDGDCFLVETGTAPHRILIDGGRKATASFLRSYLQDLPPREHGPLIDLMVLTHIDGDHIAGLLELIPRLGRADVGEIWFNGLQHARLARGDPPPKLVKPVVPRQEPLLQLDFRQAGEFDDAVTTQGWCWNESFSDKVVAIPAGGSLPVIPLDGGPKITLLGPPREKLGAFAAKWEFWYRNLTAEEDVLPLRPAPELTVAGLPKLATSDNKADDAAPNGTSITFVVEYNGKRALFCADAHPDDLALALERFGGSGRLEFQAIKVAHHGSAANNTSRLIDRLESPLWLISTNGSGHGHPHAEGIARIVLAQSREKKRLLFNYATRFTRPWADSSIEDAWRYKAELPACGQKVTVVDLE
jgi:beta-lactamase superfamily II metal-dependent hydrolase